MPSLLLPCSLRLQRLVLWALLVALPLYGCAGVLLQVLGPDHRHQATASAGAATPDNLVDRALRSLLSPQTAALLDTLRLQARQPQQAEAPHHHHGFFARHHHHAGDASVVASGGRSADDAAADAAAAGSASLPLALAPPLVVPVPTGRPEPWPPSAEVRWHSPVPGRLERPPRA